MISMPSFRYGDQSYAYSVELVESRKKSISIQVLPNGMVDVKAPSHTPTQLIKETMSKRARWIVRHVEQIKQQQSGVLPREYISGETHYYMGRRYVLKVIPSDHNKVKLTRGCFEVRCAKCDKESVQLSLEHWYKEHAREMFERRLKNIAADINWLDITPPITVRNMKKQWGSCSTHGRISLNWNLVKAPLECIDYVIIHELCHLKEHNHSKKFYELQD